jgi:hypothetical protein
MVCKCPFKCFNKLYKVVIKITSSDICLLFMQQQIESFGVRVMVFNVTFNNISAVSGRSVLLVEETRVPGENLWPAASYMSTFSFFSWGAIVIVWLLDLQLHMQSVPITTDVSSNPTQASCTRYKCEKTRLTTYWGEKFTY